MHLPFGDLMLGAGPRKGGFLDLISDVSNSKQAEVASNESLEYVKAEEPSSEVQNKDQQNGDANFCCWKLYDATESARHKLQKKKDDLKLEIQIIARERERINPSRYSTCHWVQWHR